MPKYTSPDGRVFCSMQEARFDFCDTHNCIDCALEKHANEQGETCDHYAVCHPDEAARLMGYEVVEEEPPQTKNDSHKMTIEEYQLAASRTAVGKCRDLANAGLGLTGEAGEVADLIKKHLYQGHDLPREKVVEELGDLMWYIALTANLIGKGMEEIMQANIDKLWSRYPNGFRAEDSIHRKEEGRKRDM